MGVAAPMLHPNVDMVAPRAPLLKVLEIITGTGPYLCDLSCESW